MSHFTSIQWDLLSQALASLGLLLWYTTNSAMLVPPSVMSSSILSQPSPSTQSMTHNKLAISVATLCQPLKQRHSSDCKQSQYIQFLLLIYELEKNCKALFVHVFSKALASPLQRKPIFQQQFSCTSATNNVYFSVDLVQGFSKPACHLTFSSK